MHHLKTIIKKELRAYFNSPIAYIFITAYLILTNWLFFRSFFLISQAEMRNYFSLLPFIFLFFLPAITMRLWAEEKKTNTLEILLTWPVREWEVVLGKFCAALLFLIIILACSFTVPISIALLGQPDLGVILGNYVGTLFLGASYLAIGLYLSSLTKNQIVAFIIAVVVSFFFFIISEPFFLQSIPSFLQPLFQFVGLSGHFDSIARGVLDSRDIFYYLSVISFFLFLNIRQVESRKWQ
ncbi:ABC transporter [Candidatus Peregrinibacteria bacterium CG1_02_41_10]|nr:MAG: ABC transporter [Candidatus Peregrinibacteria bacterium CG1_02_41_10]